MIFLIYIFLTIFLGYEFISYFSKSKLIFIEKIIISIPFGIIFSSFLTLFLNFFFEFNINNIIFQIILLFINFLIYLLSNYKKKKIIFLFDNYYLILIFLIYIIFIIIKRFIFYNQHRLPLKYLNLFKKEISLISSLTYGINTNKSIFNNFINPITGKNCKLSLIITITFSSILKLFLSFKFSLIIFKILLLISLIFLIYFYFLKYFNNKIFSIFSLILLIFINGNHFFSYFNEYNFISSNFEYLIFSTKYLLIYNFILILFLTINNNLFIISYLSFLIITFLNKSFTLPLIIILFLNHKIFLPIFFKKLKFININNFRFPIFNLLYQKIGLIIFLIPFLFNEKYFIFLIFILYLIIFKNYLLFNLIFIYFLILNLNNKLFNFYKKIKNQNFKGFYISIIFILNILLIISSFINLFELNKNLIIVWEYEDKKLSNWIIQNTPITSIVSICNNEWNPGLVRAGRIENKFNDTSKFNYLLIRKDLNDFVFIENIQNNLIKIYESRRLLLYFNNNSII